MTYYTAIFTWPYLIPFFGKYFTFQEIEIYLLDLGSLSERLFYSSLKAQKLLAFLLAFSP